MAPALASFHQQPESFNRLHDMTVATLNFSRPNGQIILASGLVIQVISSLWQIAIGCLHRGLFGSFRFLMGTQGCAVRSIKAGRSPILLTERTGQVDEFITRLTGLVKHIVVLKGGMGIKQRRVVAEQLIEIPEGEERVLLATGRYIGGGFDDARLDTLFLATPVRGAAHYNNTLAISIAFTPIKERSSFTTI
jgi:hypothetical protein